MKPSHTATAGLALARLVVALAIAPKNDFRSAAAFASSMWPDQPAIGKFLASSVGAGDIGQPGWSSELLHTTITADFVEAVRARTVLDRLIGLRNVPFNAKVPLESAGVSGTWVGSGAAIPVSASSFSSATLYPTKAAAMVILDDELLRLATPEAISSIQASMVSGIVSYLDRQFLDPSVAGVDYVNPASINNGGTAVSSTGTSAAAMTEDLGNMLDAAGDMVFPTWVMASKTVANLALSLQQPDIKVLGGFLLGLPILCTASSPAPVGSPAMPRLISLIDADGVLVADEGGAEVQLGSQAGIQMTDNANMNSVTPTPANMVSMYQTLSSAVRVIREVNWKRTRTTAAVHMEVAY